MLELSPAAGDARPAVVAKPPPPRDRDELAEVLARFDGLADRGVACDTASTHIES